MQIIKNTVVSIHYSLHDKTGNLLESSKALSPLTYIHGHSQLIPGMEEGLEGKVKGDRFELEIPPEKGYGTRNEQLVQQVSLKAFSGQLVEAGMQFNTQNGQLVTVTGINSDIVTVDANHPLAGTDLHFKIEVVDIRQATPEEIEHGHVHGPDTHQH